MTNCLDTMEEFVSYLLSIYLFLDGVSAGRISGRVVKGCCSWFLHAGQCCLKCHGVAFDEGLQQRKREKARERCSIHPSIYPTCCVRSAFFGLGFGFAEKVVVVVCRC